MKLSVSLITGIIFSLIALLHLLRLVYGWEAQIGTWVTPMWVSWVAVAAGALLAWLNIRHCHKCAM